MDYPAIISKFPSQQMKKVRVLKIYNPRERVSRDQLGQVLLLSPHVIFKSIITQ